MVIGKEREKVEIWEREREREWKTEASNSRHHSILVNESNPYSWYYRIIRYMS